jgi:hypothetical protein
MAISMALIEREHDNPVTNWSNKIVCTKRDDGSFSLQLVVMNDYGVSREPSFTGIRSPEAFIDGLLSVTAWSELRFQADDIIADICISLHALDAEFADAVIDYVGSSETD